MTLTKDRRAGILLLALLALGALAYIAIPPLLSIWIEKAYHSDAAIWQGLMSHRQDGSLAAYQAKGTRLFRDFVAIALTMCLTWLWIVWDREGATLSWRALKRPRPDRRTLSALGVGLLIALATRGTLPYPLLLLAALLTLLADPANRPFARFERALTWLLRPRISIPLVLMLALATFFVKFPPADFDSLVFFDDYPTIYTVTVKGWEMLKQGGIFGWDQRLMGGYCTVHDVSHNEIFFMLPFLPFGSRVAFHLMILFFYLLFPLLLYWYARLEFAQGGARGERAATLALWIGFFVVFGYFDNLLYWGMVNSFIGLNFMLLDLTLFAYLRQGRRYAGLALILSLSATLYAATGFFVYALLLLGLDFLWHFQWKLVPRLAFVMVAAFLVTLTFTYQFLRFPDYFVQSDEIYRPVAYSVGEIIAQSVAALPRVTDPRFWLLGRPVRYQGMVIVSLPILAVLGWAGLRAAKGSMSRTELKAVLATLAVMLATLAVSPSLDMFISRIRFVLPVTLALVYAAWQFQEERLHPAPLLLILTILMATLPSRLLEPITHVRSLSDYNAPLMAQIESLDSDLLILESMGGYNLATEGEGITEYLQNPTHMESYFPFETTKSYLSNNQEGYHHSIYRRNFITSGAFRGKLLDDWPMGEIKAFLNKWGVRHLVLWSQISQDYLGSDADFRQLWSDGEWAIYEYAKAAPGQVVMSSGAGRIHVVGYFEQQVQLGGARAGDLVKLRMNYFPAWRAYDEQGQEVALQEDDEQMAFFAPRDGSYTVTLRYPRYIELTILALATLLVAGVASRFHVLGL